MVANLFPVTKLSHRGAKFKLLLSGEFFFTFITQRAHVFTRLCMHPSECTSEKPGATFLLHTTFGVCSERWLCAERIVCFVPRIKGRACNSDSALLALNHNHEICAQNKTSPTLMSDSWDGAAPSRLPIVLFKINRSESRWNAAH